MTAPGQVTVEDYPVTVEVVDDYRIAVVPVAGAYSVESDTVGGPR